MLSVNKSHGKYLKLTFSVEELEELYPSLELEEIEVEELEEIEVEELEDVEEVELEDVEEELEVELLDPKPGCSFASITKTGDLASLNRSPTLLL
jgi:hypothetical protein